LVFSGFLRSDTILLVHFSSLWFILVPSGPFWFLLVPSILFCLLFTPSGSLQVPPGSLFLVPSGAGFSGSFWFFLVLSGSLKFNSESGPGSGWVLLPRKSSSPSSSAYHSSDIPYCECESRPLKREKVGMSKKAE
jgi:hypothetical protein